ncbi:hypothetical protein BO94DRAFT_477092 [Aspergillus sclerotioniger CBS 115572]|uniref:Uncharacterized protein n=1 Tax=Aspergillus sclerotioniger CBS 115572 TaxID=1450535 RepID=A0A317V946_9EURO|nr:hypothetical protein BO94DRAFT_477092 [Aspergillus sclerotioniger CBS 115572]PWY70894.1 hypothetical protein BO94DRAFT_477092 [Aspergillus sclerotioniger CBS 115572]
MAPPAASLRVAGPHPCPFSPAAPLMIQFHPANWQIPFASTHPCAGPGRQPQRSPATAGAGHLPGPAVSAGRPAALALQVLRTHVACHRACKRSGVRK